MHRKPHCHHVSINAVEGQTVGFKHKIRGVAKGAKRVQLLVFSADGLWYLQKDAVLKANGHWHADCTFGFPESVHDFQIVAVVDGPVVVPALPAVPDGLVKSRAVRVVRTAPAPVIEGIAAAPTV